MPEFLAYDLGMMNQISTETAQVIVFLDEFYGELTPAKIRQVAGNLLGAADVFEANAG